MKMPNRSSAVARYYQFREAGKTMRLDQIGTYYAILAQYHRFAVREKELRNDECEALITKNLRPKCERGSFWSNLFRDLFA